MASEVLRLAEALDLGALLLAGLLVLARVTPVVYLVPFLGGSAVPAAVRIVVAGAVSLAVLPAALAEPAAVDGFGHLLVLLLKEVVVGVGLGLLAAVAFHVLAMAGELAAIARGATMSRALDPLGGEEASPLSVLHLLFGVTLFLALGGHRAFLAALSGSYHALPLGRLPEAEAGFGALALATAELTGAAIAAALLLAAPVFAAAVLLDVTLGLLGRTAPQVGTYFMAMPLRAALGLAMVLLALGVAAPDLGPLLSSAVDAVRGASSLLGGAGAG